MTRKGLPGDYGSYHFRSHLEMRWAIFLDTLEVKWDYEPQGFLTDGSAYLPDFIIFAAGGTLWAEVKPAWEADPEGVAKWRKFADQRPRPSRAVLLVGPPAVGGTYTAIGGDINSDNPLKGPWEEDGYGWRPCPSGYHFDIAFSGTSRVIYAEDDCPDDAGRGGEERIEAAVRAAMSYRIGRDD